jgi:hypothetical protein
VNEGSLVDCYADGAISGGVHIGDTSSYGWHIGRYVGGLVGYAGSSTTINCYATGVVACGCSGFSIGGLAGAADSGSILSGCYATGNVSGETGSGGNRGLAGSIDNATVMGCYATGSVTVYQEMI